MCGNGVEWVRSCKRSKWRLHADPSILTPGRYYFLPDSAKCSPVPTRLGSLDWVKDKDIPHEEQTEWDGGSHWDAGTAPLTPPLQRLVGSSRCITDGATGGDAAIGPSVDFGVRTVCMLGEEWRFPARCFVNFSISYPDRRTTYYNRIEVTLREAECEAIYEGAIGQLGAEGTLAFAVLRVSPNPGGGLQTQFRICERPGTVTVTCCANPLPSTLTIDLTFILSTSPISVIETDRIEWENITLTWGTTPPGPSMGEVPAWWAWVKGDGTQGTQADHCARIIVNCQEAIFGGFRFHAFVIDDDGQIAGWWDIDPADVVCEPFDAVITEPKLRIGQAGVNHLCDLFFDETSHKPWATLHLRA